MTSVLFASPGTSVPGVVLAPVCPAGASVFAGGGEGLVRSSLAPAGFFRPLSTPAVGGAAGPDLLPSSAGSGPASIAHPCLPHPPGGGGDTRTQSTSPPEVAGAGASSSFVRSTSADLNRLPVGVERRGGEVQGSAGRGALPREGTPPAAQARRRPPAVQPSPAPSP